ncbi:calcineurin-like phosphoesterase family protein [Neorickettsia helminthoeca str. Oregon]|uniref:Calcineurin-like phosphoesterase family protein n=1 Tax=Neorickettsia helminthoeca str. Oregon TaxID=1286528 RepID=X5HML3_9RICK|nr:metallophosphoesterase [Neorickettsia helminthoeca]AHX11715.1 calcineurin-like phosphoesterase family protein [Neorickettsia helminthoeca str. Oregon]
MNAIAVTEKYLLILFILFYSSGFAYEFHWFQLMGGNRLWFRLVGEKLSHCPNISIDGEEQQMNEYSQRSDAFPKSCFFELDLSRLPHSVIFDGKEISPTIDTNAVKRIAIIGDTGCRVKSFISQDCEKNWFFQEIVGLVVGHSPDMVIHVGDYIYREKGYQDNWDTWTADFFLPAARLLDSNIPLLLVRGNHEDCRRNGNGWFALLGRENKECQDHEQPYAIDINGRRLAVIDSTYEKNLLTDLEEINATTDTKRTWILTHKPIIFRNKAHIPVGYIEFAKKLKKEIELFISGHIHVAQFLKFNGRVQLISGNGGALLSYGMAPHSRESQLKYGFAIIDFLDDRVKITSYDRFNNEMMSMYLPVNN